MIDLQTLDALIEMEQMLRKIIERQVALRNETAWKLMDWQTPAEQKEFDEFMNNMCNYFGAHGKQED